MLEMYFDVNSGLVVIDNYFFELKDLEMFKNLEFYKLFLLFMIIGYYYFFIDNIDWKD